MPTKIFFLKRIWTKLLRLRYAGGTLIRKKKIAPCICLYNSVSYSMIWIKRAAAYVFTT